MHNVRQPITILIGEEKDICDTIILAVNRNTSTTKKAFCIDSEPGFENTIVGQICKKYWRKQEVTMIPS